MSRKIVIDRTAKALVGDVRKKVVKTVVDAAFDTMAEALLEGEVLNLYGLGTFQIKTRNARNARNPQTKELILVPPRKHLHFRVSGGLKKRIALLNEHEED